MNTNDVQIISDTTAALVEAELYLNTLLAFIRDARQAIDTAGCDASAWDALAETMRVKCKEVMPYTKIDLGNFLLHLNARVANVPLVLQDLTSA